MLNVELEKKRARLDYEINQIIWDNSKDDQEYFDNLLYLIKEISLWLNKFNGVMKIDVNSENY